MNLKFYPIIFLSLFALKLSSQEVIHKTFVSSSLDGATIAVNVYLPKDYDENGIPYNLYVFLHGSSGSNHHSVTNALEPRLNQLILNGEIDPLIVVFPNAQGANFGNRHFWFNSERNGQYSDLIALDLLDWVDDNYNVSDIRAVGGFSMGGDGAIRMGLHESEKFIALISHSSYSALDHFPTLVPQLIGETGQSGPPYTYKPGNGGLTFQVFGAASAWSPNLENPNIPDYNLDFPLDANGVLIDTVFARWKINADPDSIIRHNWNATKDVPVSLYFDVGMTEGLFSPVNALLNSQLDSLVLFENYEINYKYLEFEGGHVLTQAKVDSSLLWLNEVFSTNVITSSHEIAKNDLNLSIYPNPTTNFITIEFNGKTDQDYRIEIINLKGHLIESKLVNVLNTTIFDISNYESGVYQLIMKDPESGQKMTEKFIKI